MSNNREISQFSSFVYVDDNTRNIGIATTATPYVGIGTTNPTTKLYVVGDTYITGILTANRIFSNLYGEFTGSSVISNTIVGTSLSISGISTLGNVQISSGIVTATSGVVTYYGDGSKLTGISGGVSISTNTTNQSQFIPYVTGTGSTTGFGVSTTGLTFNPSTGNLVAGGTVTANSDEKLKTNIKTIDNALDKVLSLRGVEYDRIDTLEHQIGVIAQEVEAVLPEIVHTDPETGMKSVAYGNLSALFIEAIKEVAIDCELFKSHNMMGSKYNCFKFNENSLLDKKYSRIIYTSSSALYGENTSTPHGADDRIFLDSPYRRVKALSEEAVLQSSKGVVVRIGNVYGPGMSESRACQGEINASNAQR